MWFRLRKGPKKDSAVTSLSSSSSGTSDVFYDVAMRRLDEQMERRESYAARVSSAFTVGATVLPVTAGLLTLDSGRPPTCALFLLCGSIAAFLFLVGFSMAALLPATLDLRPDLYTLAEYDATYQKRSIPRWVAKECIESIRENDCRLGRKALYVSCSVLFLATETALLAVAALLTIL
jgi:hypothetical protein